MVCVVFRILPLYTGIKGSTGITYQVELGGWNGRWFQSMGMGDADFPEMVAVEFVNVIR